MFNFGKNRQADNQYLENLANRITELTKQVAALKGEHDARKQAVALEDQLLNLKKRIETLQIERERLEEKNAREERELRHMIGLEKKRQEFEIEKAKTETTLQVQQGNLAEERKRFDRDMKFREERFTSEVTYIKELMGEILKRLPEVTAHFEKAVEIGSSSKEK